jgi:hypothetical protein
LYKKLYRKQRKKAKNCTQTLSKKRYYECINEDIEMKNAIAMIAFVSATTFAQTTYYNNSNGTPLGTAQQVGSTTYYNNANGTPLGTAQQVGNTTYYNNANGTPLGTAQSAQPIQQAPITQFSAPSAPTFPTSPLFPTSPIGR